MCRLTWNVGQHIKSVATVSDGKKKLYRVSESVRTCVVDRRDKARPCARKVVAVFTSYFAVRGAV